MSKSCCAWKFSSQSVGQDNSVAPILTMYKESHAFACFLSAVHLPRITCEYSQCTLNIDFLFATALHLAVVFFKRKSSTTFPRCETEASLENRPISTPPVVVNSICSESRALCAMGARIPRHFLLYTGWMLWRSSRVFAKKRKLKTGRTRAHTSSGVAHTELKGSRNVLSCAKCCFSSFFFSKC